METGKAPSGQSYWIATAPDISFPALSGTIEVDVAVVGGGMAGLTAAALLKEPGRTVAVLEARRIGRQATGRSTAKVTSQHGVTYAQLVHMHGEDGARLYGDANQAAVERVSDFVREFRIACDFERKPAYVYTRSPERAGVLEEEAKSARRIGLPAELVHEIPLPFPVEAAVRFTDQAQFHPCKYLAGLARHIDGGGSHVFEGSRVTDIETGSLSRVVTQGGTIVARDVIVASHLPFISKGMFFAKAYPQSEPILAAPIEASRAPDGMFISADTPVLSVLRAPGPEGPYLIAAGGLHKPGHTEEAQAMLARLESQVREHFGVRDIAYRWTNHDYWPMDGVPFVGRASAGSEHLFVATGFHAWGLSGGTVAGMILADTLSGRPNRWAALFDATRIKPVASAPAFLTGNLHVAGHFVGGYLSRKSKSPQELDSGRAGIFTVKGAPVATYRDEAGELHQVSALCTHMKCVVGWNPTDRTWDCPCHGSRFAADGDVLAGPAVHPLSRVG